MSVTGFWPVFKNLKATLDYADNPDKTTLPEYLDEDLYAALRYVENDNKTDRQVFVGGINCSAQNAYAEMIAVQRRFGLRGKVVGYHGIQSFREGEVTPEQASNGPFTALSSCFFTPCRLLPPSFPSTASSRSL